MLAHAIGELLSREPFRPFRIRASSGATHDVLHPELVVVMKSELFIAQPASDHFDLVPLLHIAGLELKRNGTSRRRRRG
ncbi:MAG: hypothetical protein U1A27_10595 [Phycisphaerae bacterium]